jgi:hypothetical protein
VAVEEVSEKGLLRSVAGSGSGYLENDAENERNEAEDVVLRRGIKYCRNDEGREGSSGDLSYC